MPSLFHTDNVKSDRTSLEGVLASLLNNGRRTIIPKPVNNEEISNPEQDSKLPVSTLPDTMNIFIFSVPEDVNNAYQNIFDGLETNNCLYVGFDCEFIARNHRDFNSRSRRAQASLNEVSLIQICCKEQVYLFRTFKFTGDTFPEKLQQLLEYGDVKKIGKNVSGDFTFLRKGYQINPEGMIELDTFCKEKGVIEKKVFLFGQNLCYSFKGIIT